MVKRSAARMRRYLVLVPGEGDEPLFEQLVRLAATEPSEFHVIVPRWPVATGSVKPDPEHNLDAVVRALADRGVKADGEVGEVSLVGSVAHAAERGRYDALVVPVPGVNALDTLDLEVACRLHQIDIPEVVVLSRWRGSA
jgi:hypothetical protein